MIAQSLAINRSVDISRQTADTAYNIRKGDIMKKKLWFTLSAVCFAAFVILIILLKTADVGVWLGKEVGLYTLNKAVFDAFGGKLNGFWYSLTGYFGYLAVVIAIFFVGVGLYQAIKRKSLKKVDDDLYFLAVALLILAICYFLFEVIKINYRPVLLDGQTSPEASFPSSHTMLSVGIFGLSLVEILLRVKSKKLKIPLACLAGILAAVSAAGRLLSSAHWFTDVVGGTLFALAVVFAFCFSIDRSEREKDEIGAETTEQ